MTEGVGVPRRSSEECKQHVLGSNQERHHSVLFQVSTNISYQEFKDLLTELFAAGGITKERIVVLFFFCSDVAIRSLRRGAELCRQFLHWSFSFITEKVCSWVRSHGGWVRCLSLIHI